MAWNHQLDDNPLQKPFFFQFSDFFTNLSPGFRQLQISPVEIWVGRWLFDIWIRPSSTLVVILPRVWQKIMPGGTNPMQLGVQNLVCHGTWVYGKLRETWGFLVDNRGYNEIQWEENCILKLWSYTFSFNGCWNRNSAGWNHIDLRIQHWVESSFFPLKFNSDFTPEKWWERKTRTFPFGAKGLFLGANLLLNFREGMLLALSPCSLCLGNSTILTPHFVVVFSLKLTASLHLKMGVSKNHGTPKSSILIGFSIICTIHFGSFPIFGLTPK